MTKRISCGIPRVESRRDFLAPALLHEIPAVDYVFAEPPRTIELPKGTPRESRIRLAQVTFTDPAQAIALLKERVSPEAATRFARQWAALHSDEKNAPIRSQSEPAYQTSSPPP